MVEKKEEDNQQEEIKEPDSENIENDEDNNDTQENTDTEETTEDENSEEAAVNIPNNGCIKDMPDDIVVEVPAKINSSGIHGIKLNNYPRAFCSLLNSQVGCIRMTTEAVLNQSKSDAYFALLADPVVDNARSAEKLLDTIIELQNDYLGYLR